MSILRLAIPSPLRRLFDYLPPEGCQSHDLQPGIRISAPFGRRTVVGILVEVATSSEIEHAKLKPANAILDKQPPLPPHLFKLARWAASYYQHPEGDALQQALPVLLRKGHKCEYQHELLWRAVPTATSEQLASNATRMRALLNFIMAHPDGVSAEAIKAANLQVSSLKALAGKGLLESFQARPQPLQQDQSILLEAPLKLNSEQQACLEQISAASQRFSTFLLEGVTGSGKTEVYLQAIAEQLQQGKQALILVPEIGLTPQTVNRFQKRFNLPVVSLHSNLSDKQRLDAWLQAREGLAKIIIGTRSAIFTPMAQPGIIIIDEEHDSSFKQQDGFRYSARDTAIYRARAEQIPIILGSATPALESIHNAINQRFHWLKLKQRAGGASLPQFELLDIRQENLHEGLCQRLIQGIKQHLEAGNQALVFLNRRGYSPTLTCHDCGWIADCERCDAHMTLHRSPPRLHCHHCDHQRAIPKQCPNCNSTHLKPVGAGTERTEQALIQIFPNFPVIRVDRDSTQRKTAMQDIMAQVNRGEPCILIGTQMLAKGHHFPKVSLVAILNADSGLFSSDFKGMERTAQMLLQVAGRAGRAQLKGQVLMQTYHADHPALLTLISQGYNAFAQEELNNRRMAGLPPYSHFALFRAEANKVGRAEAFLAALRKQLEEEQLIPEQVHWAGPFPSAMERKAGMHRAQLTLFSQDRKSLQQLLKYMCWYLENSKESRSVRWSIDVDPMETF